MPCHCLLGSFQSLLYDLVPAPLICSAERSWMRPTELPHYSSTNQHFKKSPLNSRAAAGALRPFLVTAAINVSLFPWHWGCLPRASSWEWPRQDTDAQGPGQRTPKFNNSLLFSTLPCRDGTLNSEEMVHPKIQWKKLFIRVNMRHCYRKRSCYYSYTRYEGAQRDAPSLWCSKDE